ncbi:expressed unknown protein [Seminavis robusta]|uniref:Uncharacterized protein n=1 Tax=Seminavis robusta TaxID=568900 RepID=A0A9N8H5L5_9STRA|nr:expressed unknown protein [Seminavis robusta]|eukprot:Sro146_g067490.1 n/a (655) ;mRNA; f:29346-31391
MMNLPVSRKRSASPLEEELNNNNNNNSTMSTRSNAMSMNGHMMSGAGSPPLGGMQGGSGNGNGASSSTGASNNGSGSGGMNYDQLSALHYAKRLRLAQAQAAAAAQEAALFRPTMMDLYGLNVPMPLQSRFLHQNPYYPSMNMNMNPMNMNMNAMHNMNMNMNSVSPTNSMNGHPLSWRAQANLHDIPTLPALNQNGNSNPNMNVNKQEEPEGSIHRDCHSPTETEALGESSSSLEQLSAFASGMPSIPIKNNTNDRTISPSTTNTNTTANQHSSLVGGLFCAPASKAHNNDKPTRPFASIPIKKAHLPTPDPNGKANHWEDRPHVALAIDEDANWLSEFQCFLRSDILEVFVASPATADNRNASKKIADCQIGVRCRFCAHLHPTERASRSSAFPSSVRQIYQSFTMMLREHLSGQCQSMPADVAAQFAKLKGQSAQSASDSKRYWIYAAQKLGMVDTSSAGIQMTQETIQKANSSPELLAFGKSPELKADLDACQDNLLVTSNDQPVASEFVHAVVSQARLVHLAASEKIGNRSCLTVGLPGLACKHCCAASRSGLARVFPARKRNLKTKVQDLYDHLRRCTLVPPATQQELVQLYQQQQAAGGNDKKSKVFYARLWRRLGHENEETGLKTPPRGNSPIQSPVASPNNNMSM